MLFGFVCTNYNNSEFTGQAIKTLLLGNKHECHVVVVDNQSNAENIAKLQAIVSEYSAVKCILNSNNVGYFRGLNIGIRYLRKEFPSMEWIVVGNNDLEFPKNFADSISENTSRLKSFAVISPDVVTVDGEHQNPHVISGISSVRELFYDLYYSNYYLGTFIYKLAMIFRFLSDRSDEKQWQVAQSIQQGHGSCYLLGPRFFQQFEELWAPTFLMGEEYFLSKQLGDVGQQVFYEPAIKVVHHWHASLAKLPSKQRWAYAREAHIVYRKYVKIFN